VYPVGVLIFSLVRLTCIKTKEMNITGGVSHKDTEKTTDKKL